MAQKSRKTGRKLGRPFVYIGEKEELRPVTVSFRVPHDVYTRMQAYLKIHYTSSVTELLLDGLKMRLEEDDPRWPAQQSLQDYSNTAQHAPALMNGHQNLAPAHVVVDASPHANQLPPPQQDEPDFDPRTHVLGNPCIHKHYYKGTMQSLRKLKKNGEPGECKECVTARKQRQRERETASV